MGNPQHSFFLKMFYLHIHYYTVDGIRLNISCRIEERNWKGKQKSLAKQIKLYKLKIKTFFFNFGSANYYILACVRQTLTNKKY